MALVVFITHPDVTIDPVTPVTEWSLSARGLERMSAFCGHSFVPIITRVFCSGEKKARDGADMLARRLGLPVNVHLGLGENDRSSTGYLPQPEFVEVAREFFRNPDESIQGWERAVDAQRRVVSAVRDIVAGCPGENIALVSHGGVGTLLMCHLRQRPISLSMAPPVREGGCYFAFDAESFGLLEGWEDVEKEARSLCRYYA